MVQRTRFTKCGHEDFRLPRNVPQIPAPKELPGNCKSCDCAAVEYKRSTIIGAYKPVLDLLDTELKGLKQIRTRMGVVGRSTNDPDPATLKEDIDFKEREMDTETRKRESEIRKAYDSLTPRWGNQSDANPGIMSPRSQMTEEDEDKKRGIGQSGNAPTRSFGGTI